MAKRERMGGCMRARWQLLWVVGWHWTGVQDGGQAGARSRGKGQLEARYEQSWPDEVGYCGQDGGVGHWGGIPDRGWDGVPDT